MVSERGRLNISDYNSFEQIFIDASIFLVMPSRIKST